MTENKENENHLIVNLNINVILSYMKQSYDDIMEINQVKLLEDVLLENKDVLNDFALLKDFINKKASYSSSSSNYNKKISQLNHENDSFNNNEQSISSKDDESTSYADNIELNMFLITKFHCFTIEHITKYRNEYLIEHNSIPILFPLPPCTINNIFYNNANKYYLKALFSNEIIFDLYKLFSESKKFNSEILHDYMQITSHYGGEEIMNHSKSISILSFAKSLNSYSKE